MELMEAPMGIINWYWYLSFKENQRIVKTQKEEEERKKKEAAQQKNSKNGSIRPHPSQGAAFTPQAMEELVEELEEGGGL